MHSFDYPWLATPWSKGIAAGIISGLLVAWISHLILSRRYSRRASRIGGAANREIMQAVRLVVAEGHIPRRDVIHALANATARRHGLEPSDLYNAPEIAEELIKDVMESSLLSAAKKSDMCAQLSYLLLPVPPAAGSPGAAVVPQILTGSPSTRTTTTTPGQYRRPEERRVSALTGILAGVLSGVFAGHELLGGYLGGIPHWLRIGLEALAGIAAALAALLIVALVFGNRSEGRLEENEESAAESGAARNSLLGG